MQATINTNTHIVPMMHVVPTTNTYFEPLLNDEQAAALLGEMHTKTLQRLARNGQIPAHKIGRFWYFRASELDRWLSGTLTSGSQSVRELKGRSE